MKQAIEYMKQQKFEEAATLFNEIIEGNPDNPLGYVNFGNLLLHVNDLEKAKLFFEKALEIDDTVATAFYGLGNLYYEQEDFPKAQKNLQRSIELGLEEGDIYYLLGMSLLSQSHDTLALPYLLRATELAPNDDQILFQYGLALAQQQYLEDAKGAFQHVLKINEAHSDAHYNLGVLALYNEQAKEALDHFNKALQIQPDHLLAANGKEKLEELLKGNKP